MSSDLKVQVNADIKDTKGWLDDRIEDLLLDCKVDMHSIMTTESAKRSDGLGGRDGAVDTGGLSGHMFMWNDNRKAIVGTHKDYAKNLVTGDPVPSANLYDIAEWAQRKQLLKVKSKKSQKYFEKYPFKHPFAINIWKKVQTQGPIRNPFHLRSVDVFVTVAWPRIVSKWKDRWE